MSHPTRASRRVAFVAFLAATAFLPGGPVTEPTARGADGPQKAGDAEGRTLSHEETLRWVAEHKAWRLAHKTRPIWARPVGADEVGKEFQTADRAKERARAGAWLCVGVAGEPWFQSLEKIEARYEPAGDESKRFAFDPEARRYRVFEPRAAVRNWVARVKGPGVAGFTVRPHYDPSRPLYSPAGGYVVKDDVPDPYRDEPGDVWLVQESLFQSTYVIVPDRR